MILNTDFKKKIKMMTTIFNPRFSSRFIHTRKYRFKKMNKNMTIIFNPCFQSLVICQLLTGYKFVSLLGSDLLTLSQMQTLSDTSAGDRFLKHSDKKKKNYSKQAISPFATMFSLIVIAYPFNYRDFLIFDKECSKCCELSYEGKG